MSARPPTIAVRTAAGAAVVWIAAIVGAANNGCAEDEPLARARSQRGEACQVTADCGDELACVPVAGGAIGTCVTAVFGVAPTGKECSLVDCTTNADCCDTPPETCAELLAACRAGGDAGFPPTDACDNYDRLCACDTGVRVCALGKCQSKCSDDFECTRSSAGRRCAGGTCVACAFEEDCPLGQPCVSGKCTAPCTADADCPGFERCVESKCLPSGCLTDRECIAATRKVDARCGTNGRCIVPCKTDLECDDPSSFSFFACVAGECTNVGCDSDKDCRLLLVPDGGFVSPKQHIVCREKNPVSSVGGTTP